MEQYVAFLRAVNVGGRVVKMDALRALFASFGYAGARTFIASGNVVFETRATPERTIENVIESGLKTALGYEAATFVRTGDEVIAIAEYAPFAAEALAAAAALNVGFLKQPPDDAALARLMALRTDIDDFHAHGREVYWLCRRKQSESTFSNAALERALRQPATLRSDNTVKRLAATLR